jgi:hypothetical protein
MEREKSEAMKHQAENISRKVAVFQLLSPKKIP